MPESKMNSLKGTNPLFAGLDVSTQSCKLVVIDPEAGLVVYVDQVDYDRDLPFYGTVDGVVPGMGEGISESDPRMWIKSVEVALRRMRKSGFPGERIRCMSVCAQQHGLVGLAADGTLVRPRSKLWNDFSTAEECRILTEAVGGPEAMIDEVGNSQRTGYTASKILHMKRHEPELFDRTTTFFLVHNYINWYLTGGAMGGVAVMEPGDASGMALWHPGKRCWSGLALGAIDPSMARKLPPILPSDQTIGRLARHLAEPFVLSTECKIDAGCGDNMYGAVATGNFLPGIVTVNLGTSGTAYTFLEEPFIDPSGEIAAFCDSTGHHLPLICVSNLANRYDGFLERFGLTHPDFDELMKKTSPGNGGRALLPWFGGERTPDLPDAAPVYFGFGLGDFEPALLCRAVVEGHVLNLFDGVSRMPVTPTEIRLTGGLSRSASWRQVIADVFDAEAVPVSGEGEGAAMGAAVHAAWVWQKEEGWDSSLEEVAAPFVVLDESRRVKPTPDAREANQLLRRLFLALSRRARGLDAEDPFSIRKAMLAE